MAKIGYARVSTVGQRLDVQLDKLNAYGCEKIYADKRSGTTAQRPEMMACLDYVREGDQLVITRLDRLARSTYHLVQIGEQLKAKDVELVVLDQGIDTSTPTGKLMFNLLASIAEFENELRRERQAEGIEKAKANGVKFGAKKKVGVEQAKTMIDRQNAGESVKSICHSYNISQSTFYRVRAEYLKQDETYKQ